MVKKYIPTVQEYLEFEQSCGTMMSVEARKINRNKYKVTEEDLINFYGIDYPGKQIFHSKYRKESVKKEKFSKEQSIEQLHLFEKIFDGTDDAFVRIRCRATGEYYSYPVAALLDEDKLYNILNSNRFTSKDDLMYSLNTYNNVINHSQNNIFTLNSFAIDLDYKEVKRLSEKKPNQIINMLERAEFNRTIPAPNIIEYGNNIRLIYILEKSYSTKNVNTLVTRICNVIGERLSDYGAKGQPITTYARIVNSINSRVNKRIKVTYLDIEKYNITYLKDTVLPPLPEWYSEYKMKTKRKKGNVIHFTKDFKAQGKARQYNINRINDFFTIVNHFDGDVDGRRYMCYQVRNHAKLAGMDNREAREILKEFNNSFRYPLRWNIIEQDTRNVERKQYYYKSESILNYLGIDSELEVILNLKAILSKTEYKRRDNEANKIRQKAKYRNEEGLTKQEVNRRDEFILWARMELDGYSYKAMAKELGYSHHNKITRKIKKVYDKINYSEILEEVKNGCYCDLKVAIG